MKKAVRYVCLSLCVIALSMLGDFVWRISQDLAGKAEGAELQSAYESVRQQTFAKAEVFSHRKHHYAAIPTEKGLVVVMLNAGYSPYYRQSPSNLNYDLSQEDYFRLLRATPITITVSNVLASRIREPSLPLSAPAAAQAQEPSRQPQ